MTGSRPTQTRVTTPRRHRTNDITERNDGSTNWHQTQRGLTATPLRRVVKVLLKNLRALHSGTGAQTRHCVTLPRGNTWSTDPDSGCRTRSTIGNIAISAEGARSTS